MKLKIKENAFKYLNAKKGKKGKEIACSIRSMADYLLPYSKISKSEKHSNFAIRNKMVKLPEILSSDVKPSVCVEKEK